jgi:hypothetical protein
MITNFELFEGKQVGLLYHYTSYEGLIKILVTDKMESPIYGHVSFSRNKNLNFYNSVIKIIFDGDRMSDQFKIKPYLYQKNLNYKEEAEIRIKCDKDYSIKGIKKYIIGIDFLGENNVESLKEYKQKRVEGLLPNVVIRFKPMPKFKNYH